MSLFSPQLVGGLNARRSSAFASRDVLVRRLPGRSSARRDVVRPPLVVRPPNAAHVTLPESGHVCVSVARASSGDTESAGATVVRQSRRAPAERLTFDTNGASTACHAHRSDT